MNYVNPEALVTTDWLAENLDAPNLKIVEATFFLPSMKRDARHEFELGHIPGAVFFDIEEICDSASDLPHMLPDAATFAAKTGELGIGNADRIVVYDAMGGYMAAARAWWMFRVFGHDNVALVDGGLPKWMKDRHETEEGIPTPPVSSFTATYNPSLVRDAGQMLANLKSREEQVFDARSSERFSGKEPEPRPTRKCGHIPASVNLPFAKLMDKKNDFIMRPADEIAAAFEAAGMDLGKPVTATCGSGVTACVIAFAMHLMGRSDVAVYDGSWAEWGDLDDAPAEK